MNVGDVFTFESVCECVIHQGKMSLWIHTVICGRNYHRYNFEYIVRMASQLHKIQSLNFTGL